MFSTLTNWRSYYYLNCWTSKSYCHSSYYTLPLCTPYCGIKVVENFNLYHSAARCCSIAAFMDGEMEQITSMAMCNALSPLKPLTSALALFASNPRTQSNLLRRIMTCKAVSPLLFVASRLAPFCASSYTHCTHSRISYALADIKNFENSSKHAEVNEMKKNTFSNIKLFSAGPHDCLFLA